MMQDPSNRIAELERTLATMQSVAVAVSGGVDSLTLAHVAHRRLGARVSMFHAISPAVPPEATERTRRHATAGGWSLQTLDAGEFADPRYLDNPVNRCFFCKSNLYGAIASRFGGTLVSGTNLDDLADYRPGLQAAESFEVRHPYVEAGIDKATVRAIARWLQLDDVAELPASPCLSSRVETGIPVDAPKLRLIHAIEQCVARWVAAATVRCRLRRNGLVVELDETAYAELMAGRHTSMQRELERIGAAGGVGGKVDFAVYRMGSAFLR